MSVVKRINGLLNGDKPEHPFVFGELRNIDLINELTGGDLRNADEETQLYLTALGHVRAGVNMCRSLMLPKWGLHDEDGHEVMWDGYLNWKPLGEMQYSYDESLLIVRDMAKGKRPDDVAVMVEKHMEYRNKAQKVMGDDMFYMPHIGHAGLDEIYNVIGIENFSYILADDPELIDAALEAHYETACARRDIILKCYDGPVIYSGDDLGMKDTTLFNPQWLKEKYFPRLKKLINGVHEHGVSVFYHTCGNVNAVLDDLIDVGVDFLNAIEWLSGMRLTDVREQTKDKIVLHGNEDINKMVWGTPNDVRFETRRLLDEGGYKYMLPCYFPQGTNLENPYAWMDEVKKYSYNANSQ